mmetsp:Transcript_18588/g.21465  ORF Transcript_18588/g.21465 Transcript_18588/m.21465 type:complete len:589 (+) Transcript_18588:209-1975(+)
MTPYSLFHALLIFSASVAAFLPPSHTVHTIHTVHTRISISHHRSHHSQSLLQRPTRTYTGTYTGSKLLGRKLLSEDDLAKPPNPKVIQAISKSQPNQGILASDISAQTGLSLSLTQQSLAAIASLSQGDIQVTSDGELIYNFPNNKSIQQTLKNNSLRYNISTLWKMQIWPKLFLGIRVAFGVFLFVSIALIFSTLIFIQSSSGTSDRDDRDDRRGGSDGGGGFGFRLLLDLFYPRPYLYSSNVGYGYYGTYDPYSINPNDKNGQNDDDDDDSQRSGIFEGIFSYIFGDGNPNRNIEAARLREASRIIRQNDGAVTAEQLAPFCDVDDPDSVLRGEGDDFQIVDEAFVLPIVSQLGGIPTVTEDGDIVYLFEDLQVSALDEDTFYDTAQAQFDRPSSIRNSNMDYLQETRLEFNRNENIGNIGAGALGVVNLAGALYLGQVLTSPALNGYQLAGIFGVVQTSYPLLLAYAILYNIIPGIRYLYTKKLNSGIATRNSARRKWLTYLQVGGSKVNRKLQAAKSLKRRMKRVMGGGNDVVFDTRTKIEDLKAQKDDSDLKRFDELLGIDDDTSSATATGSTNNSGGLPPFS